MVGARVSEVFNLLMDVRSVASEYRPDARHDVETPATVLLGVETSDTSKQRV